MPPTLSLRTVGLMVRTLLGQIMEVSLQIQTWMIILELTRYDAELYPAYYGNKQDTPPGPVQYDNPDCNNNPSLVDFREFPIPRNGQPFGNNGRPGPDRVVIGRLSPGTNTIRCGLMTHSGAGGQNQFVPCTPLP
jgi:hypothetical protein